MLLLRRFLVVLLPALWLVLLFSSTPLATDFYPLHFAARLVLAGQSPYSAQATFQLAQVWDAPFAQAGIAYPLPFILLVTPLAMLPFPLAALLWTSIGTGLAFAGIRGYLAWRDLIFLPLAFLPFQRAVVLGQATLLWFGIAGLLMIAAERKRSWAVGLCIALLMLKPQNGLCFALAGFWWAWKTDKKAIFIAAITGGGLASLSFMIQPGWFGAWKEQLAAYQSVVQPPTLMPWGLLLIILCWRLNWWARVAALQVVLFPLSDVYSALPLLVVWAAIGGPLALFGAGLSWLWQLLQLPTTMGVFWSLIMLPLMAAAGWRSWRHRLQNPSQVRAALTHHFRP